jgi:hypothetical protein
MRINSLCQLISTRLRGKRRDCFCEACIAQEIAIEDKKSISRAMITLASGAMPDFSRYRASCAGCGKSTMTIIVNRLAWA